MMPFIYLYHAHSHTYTKSKIYIYNSSHIQVHINNVPRIPVETDEEREILGKKQLAIFLI